MKTYRQTRRDLSRADYMARPWRNITREWNDCQYAYYHRNGVHWHGPLRGKKAIPAKACSVLIVVDSIRGKPIVLNHETWDGYPDFWDFKVIVSVTKEDLWRGRSRASSVAVTCGACAWDDIADAIANDHNKGLQC